MPSWTWPLVLVWAASLVVAGALAAIVTVATIHIRNTRRALVAVPADAVEDQPAAMPVGRARVQGTYLMPAAIGGSDLPARDWGVREVSLSQPSVAGWDTYLADHPAPGMASAEAQGANDYRDAVVAAVRDTAPAAGPAPVGVADLDSLYDVYPADGDEDEPDPPTGGGGSGLQAAVEPRYPWGAGPPVASRLTGGGLPYVVPGDFVLQPVRPIRIRRRGVGVHCHHPGARSLRKVFGHRVPPRPADRVGLHREEKAPGTVAQRWGLA